MSKVNTVTPIIYAAGIKKFFLYWWTTSTKEGYEDDLISNFPKEGLGDSGETLWWTDEVQAQYQLGGSGWRAFRLFIPTAGEVLHTNWFLIRHEDRQWDYEWVHCRSYKEWGLKVLNKYLWPGERSRWNRPNYNRFAWPMPVLAFEISTFDGELKPHVAYSLKDKEILETFKYGVDPCERPMDPVYALSCWIHTDVLYTDLGNKCSGDTEDAEWEELNDEGNLESFFQAGEEYSGLPDDLSVLIAHAVLVMCDRQRAEALLKIRKFVRGEQDEWDNRELNYENCLKAAAHFWDY